MMIYTNTVNRTHEKLIKPLTVSNKKRESIQNDTHVNKASSDKKESIHK